MGTPLSGMPAHKCGPGRQLLSVRQTQSCQLRAIAISCRAFCSGGSGAWEQQHDLVEANLVLKNLDYLGCAINWEKLPQTGAGWCLNVTSNNPALQAKIDWSAHVVHGLTLEEAIRHGQAYIEDLWE